MKNIALNLQINLKKLSVIVNLFFMQAQYTSQILMVRPSSFQFNSETAASNLFQKTKNITETQIQQIALNEFDTFVSTLRQHKIEVTVIEDTAKPIKPDAVFP